MNLPDYKRLIEIDHHLQYFDYHLKKINERVQWRLNQLESEGGLMKFSRSYLNQGFRIANRKEIDPNADDQEVMVFREWLPNAEEVHLIGDFNQWTRSNP